MSYESVRNFYYDDIDTYTRCQSLKKRLDLNDRF